MQFGSVPYEADFGMNNGGGANKNWSAMSAAPMGMPQQAQIPMSLTPLNPPQMNLNQMQVPQMSYPMNMNGMNMMPQGQALPAMSTMSQLPMGAVTPLNSMTMMPMMGGTMGSIEAPGLNAVIPDLQPMSQMTQMSSMPQYTQMPQMQQMQPMPQMQPGRLSGGSCSGPNNWSQNGQHNNQMMPSQMWGYQQGNYSNMPNQQQQQHHQQHQQHQQQHQQFQQYPRSKSQYDLTSNGNYRDIRNGLNSPAIQESMKYSKGNGYNTGKQAKIASHWR